MFTSKKALVLDKQFAQISPITNIESLYFELAIKDPSNASNASNYLINRKSVVKNMPIKFDISNNLNVSTKDTDFTTNAGTYNPSVYINSFTTESIPNTSDNYIGVNSTYWDLQKLLRLYTPNNIFNSSINIVNASINAINASMDIINSSFNSLDTSLDIYIRPMYNNYNTEFDYNAVIDDGTINSSFVTKYLKKGNPNTSTNINNFSFLIKYNPLSDISDILYGKFSMGVKMQSVWVNNNPYLICMGKAIDDTNIYHDVEKWEFLYDISTNTITYLKDEFGNEGNFDFRNCINSSIMSLCANNQLYINLNNLNNSNISIKDDNNDKYSHNNKVFNSKNIQIVSSSNNIIANSNLYNLYIDAGSSNNEIYNVNNSSIYINGESNIIINCVDCSINIKGRNNILINLKNQNLYLYSNNTIIDDEAGCDTDGSKVLLDDKLFLNYSSSTAYVLDLIKCSTIYGGIGNDVSVYSDGYNTTNK